MTHTNADLTVSLLINMKKNIYFVIDFYIFLAWFEIKDRLIRIENK